MTDLVKLACKPLPRDTAPLSEEETQELIGQVPGWGFNHVHTAIQREFRFRNYAETMFFVNAVAWIAQHQDHHPDMQVSYNRCTVSYATHSVGGLSINDFICAAHINAIL